jgi:hypothetical protein
MGELEDFNAKARRGKPQPKIGFEQKQTKATKQEGTWQNASKSDDSSSFPSFASVRTPTNLLDDAGLARSHPRCPDIRRFCGV